MQQLLRTRLKATGIHICLSLIVFLILLYIIIVHWYPPPLFFSSGGWQGMSLLLLVLFVLGPLLTLVIFNPAKARHLLVFNLTVIGAVQVAAVAYATWALYDTRPAVLSIWEGRVYPVLTGDLALQDVHPRQLSSLSDQRPLIVYVRRPASSAEAVKMVDYELRYQLTQPTFHFLYTPVADHLEELFAQSIEHRSMTREDWLQAREQYLAGHKAPPRLAFLPYIGRYGAKLFVFDETGRLVDYVKP